MLKRHLALTTIGGVMLAASAIAQTSAPGTSAPNAAAPSATPAPAAESVKTESMKPAPQNLAGQGKWRASKLIGVDIYGPDDKKVGDVTEVLFDKSGKIEMITVGVGGFLGIGSKDVAIPFEQVSWSDQPAPAAAAAPAPAPRPAPSSGGTASAPGVAPAPGPAPMAAAPAPKAPEMYPDHGKITMTKDQLNAAPAVIYASR